MSTPDILAAIASVIDAFEAWHKLEWYRAGGEVSDRQWGDVIGVLEVQGSALDLEYLRRWAVQLGVVDLLERAMSAARKTQ